MTLQDLYRIAEDHGIDVASFRLPESGSLALERDGRQYIGMDNSHRYPAGEEAAHLGHELGHCLYGGVYNETTARDTIMRHEVRADRWYIEKAIPKAQLEKLLATGYDAWESADKMDTTESYIEKACTYYRLGNE